MNDNTAENLVAVATLATVFAATLVVGKAGKALIKRTMTRKFDAAVDAHVATLPR